MKKALMMKKYADLIAEVGINCNPKQDVYIVADVQMATFVRYLVMRLYAKKARSVEVDYYDTQIDKQSLMRQSITKLSQVSEWEVLKMKERTDRHFAKITLVGSDPMAYKEVSSSHIKAYSSKRAEILRPYKDKYSSNELAWCVAACPTPAWAKRVFPHLSRTQAEMELWKKIYEACRIKEENDPVQEWKNHIASLNQRADALNKYHFVALRYNNSLGTNLTVGLEKDHIWVAAQSKQKFNDEFFTPNLPTEEIFTCPDANNINGICYSSKPLCYKGQMIDKFYFEFKDGKIVNYGAEVGYDTLKSIVETDEGALSLGEAALVPYQSPISLQNIVYQETLFDENASCHLAIGDSYPETVTNYDELSKEEKKANGINSSLTHVDFMIGTKDLSIVGITADGREVQVFQDGNFVI